MIDVATGFNVGSSDAIDKRIFLSKYEMVHINDNVMPSIYFALCSNDGKLYQYDKSRTSNNETGKFIPFISEDGTVNSQLTTWSSTVLNTKLTSIISDLTTETNVRISCDTCLRNDLNTEIDNRTSSISTVTSNLNTETTNRQNADSCLRTDLSAETTNRENCDSCLRSDLSAETTNRTSNVNTLTTNLNTEIATRSCDVCTLTTNLNSEIATRTCENTTLTNNLNTESLNRSSCDNALRSDLTTETTNRTSCDTCLRSDLTSEINTRTSNISTLTTNLSTETTNRENCDSCLRSDLSAESTCRENEDTCLRTDLTTETTNRTSCDTCLRTDLNTEISNRTSAINTLTTNLNTETTNRQNADSCLRTDLSAETTNRENCDSCLRTDLTTETTNRTSCDTCLRNDITSINNLIPSQATTSNQLADKNFVNSTIQTETANFRGNWDNWSCVPTDTSLYPEDYKGSKIPTVNDYLVVNDASDYSGATLKGTWRFKYNGNWSTLGKSGWHYEYQINDEPFTASQLASINSGATCTKITNYESHINNSSNPHNVTKSQVGLGNVVNVSTTSSITEGSSENITSGGVFSGLSTKVDKVDGKQLSSNDFTNSLLTKLTNIEDNAQVNVQSDWDETCSSCDSFIKNKPTNLSDFTNDVVNNPTITIQKNGSCVDSFTLNQNTNKCINVEVPTNNNELTNGCGYAVLSNLSDVATSGSYNDLSNVPTKLSCFTNDVVNNTSITIQKNGSCVDSFTLNQSTNKCINISVPTNNNELSNGCGYAVLNNLSDVATSGSYDDLSDTPTSLSDFTNDVVNNPTITIQKNSVNVDTFTLNQSANKTINISVPTNNNELTNGCGYALNSSCGNSTVCNSLKASCDDNGNVITSTYATKSELSDVETSVTTIENKIPTEATCSNQLADKNFVNSTLQTYTANFRGNWDSWSCVPTDSSLYPQDYSGSRIPTTNDYLIVKDASDYSGATLKGTWRFKYSGNWTTQGKNGWNYEYQINDEPFTSSQLASINSGITSSLVTKLTNIETNAQVNVQSDWSETCSSCDSFIKNKPTLANVATSGSYDDLSDTPTSLSDFTNDVVCDSTITIQKNSVDVDSFTLNQSTNKSINITVPTNVSDLTNDSNFTSCLGNVTSITFGGCTYQPTSSGNVDIGSTQVQTSNLSYHNTSNLPVTVCSVSEIISHGECNCTDRLEIGNTTCGTSDTLPINVMDSILIKVENSEKYISGGPNISIGKIVDSTLYL